jgi:adenine-specific DNA glycosylase
MDEQIVKADAERLLEALMECGGIELVAENYISCEVAPFSRYYELMAEITLEKYPLRKPTDEERAEALQLLKTKENLNQRINEAHEFWSGEINRRIQQEPLELYKLQEKLGRDNGESEFRRSEFNRHYENDNCVKEYRQSLPRINQRLDEIARGLIKNS